MLTPICFGDAVIGMFVNERANTVRNIHVNWISDLEHHKVINAAKTLRGQGIQ